MKRITLLILTIYFGLVGYGQTIVNRTTPNTTQSGPRRGVPKYYDTIKVIMVASDTTKLYNFYNADGSIFGNRMTSESDLPKGGKKVFTGLLFPAPFNMYGWEVLELVETNNWVIDSRTLQGEYQKYHDHVSYLSGDKKPLPKNIIVWQHQTLK